MSSPLNLLDTLIPLTNYQEILDIVQTNELTQNYIKTAGCSVCLADLPRSEKIVAETGVRGYIIQAEEIPEAVGQLGLFSAPTVLLFYQAKEIHRQARFLDFDLLTHRIKQYQELI